MNGRSGVKWEGCKSREQRKNQSKGRKERRRGKGQRRKVIKRGKKLNGESVLN